MTSKTIKDLAPRQAEMNCLKEPAFPFIGLFNKA